MENDDFSFFPTGVSEGQDRVDAQKLAENIGGIKLENKMETGVDSVNDTMQKKKQGTVSSLSFTVTDMSSSAVKISAKKAAPRKKVLYEIGYSPMDWMKLTRTHPDLAGLNGQSNRRLITLNEVKQHQLEGLMWTVLKGRVYNIAPYMKFHPGGVDMLMKGVGKDCTSLFNKYHAWVNADILLEKCLVGILDDSKK